MSLTTTLIKDEKSQLVEFTAEEIALVRLAISKAREDMTEWKKASSVTPEQMKRKITI